MGNIVAIVGRPNVGKSTLFNRLVEQRKAIMDNEAGVTRDRSYGHAEWRGRNFAVIDTGGYVVGSEDTFESEIRKQVDLALGEANVIIFMVDSGDGLTELDKEFAKVVRAIDKPTVLVANKADNPEREMNAVEFYELGMGDPRTISSATGGGTGDLLDEVLEHFVDEEGTTEEDIPRIAIVGRPNVGKSSLLNVLLGEERTIVTDIAGTTRDSIDTRFNKFGKDLILIDTAGVRKKSKVTEDIEFYSVMRSIQAIQHSDVCLILLDAENGLESQDVNIISLANRYNKGVVIMVNKWDLIEKETSTAKEYMNEIKMKLGDMSYIPILFGSVAEKQRVLKVLEKSIEIYENLNRRISTSKLNDTMLPEIQKTPPPAYRSHYIKIKYATQLHASTPTFAFFCNYPKQVKEAYRKFITNRLREHFNFEGVPVRVFFRKK